MRVALLSYALSGPARIRSRKKTSRSYSAKTAKSPAIARCSVRRYFDVEFSTSVLVTDASFWQKARTSELTITTDRWFLSVCYRKAMCRNTEPSCRL